tara:strand:- start:1615 stop:1926 length:312 start_codon:yes stop_codon:yes gene_type:complete
MIKELIKLSNHLDSKGHRKEADYLDGVIKSTANRLSRKERREQRRNEGLAEGRNAGWQEAIDRVTMYSNNVPDTLTDECKTYVDNVLQFLIKDFTKQMNGPVE